MKTDGSVTHAATPVDTATEAASVLERGERLPVLDGLRGLAVLMVMTFHFMNDPSLAHGLVKPLFLLAHIGQTGVDLFFVLSGFLITGILVDTKSQSHYFRNFYMRRTLRIFPLYFGVLITLYVLLPLVNVSTWWPEWRETAGHQIWQWFYLTNIALFLDIPQLPGHFWTLAVEEHFYLLWPLIVFCFDERSLRRICLFVVLAAFLTRSTLAWYGLDTFYLTPCRMDALAIGAWLALELRRNTPVTRLLRLAQWTAVGGGFVLLPMFIFASGSRSPYLEAVKFSAIGIFYGALLLWLTLAPRSSYMARCATHPLLTSLGKYSYGLYVFHVFALAFLTSCLGMSKMVRWSHSALAGIGLWLLLTTTASFIPAWLSWRFYEQRFLRLKAYFASYRDTGRTASA